MTLPSTSSAGPNTSSREEDVAKLSEMFPNETTKDLENCLKVQGSVDQAVMTLLQPKTSPELSDDDSELMNSIFKGSSGSLLDSQCSLSEELHNLQKKF